MSLTSLSSAPTSVRAKADDSVLPAILVVVAVLFNAVLAFINGNITGLTAAPVIICEILVVASAQAFALSRFRDEMLPWYGLMVVVGAFAVLRAIATGTFEVKFARDLLILQTFVVLGMASTEQRMRQAMMTLQVIIIVGIFLEAISLDTFNQLFHVKDYYINTRGLVSDEFTNEDSSLYVSATRPEARYFPFFDLHRLSSFFLEPVSLGNFLIITAGFTAAFWPRLDGRQKLFLVASVVLMQFAGDGRMSALATLMIVALAASARALPANIALLFMPLVVAAAIAIVTLLGLRSGQDDLPGRIAYTVELLGQMELADWLGIGSRRLLILAVDSGVVYLVLTQSIVCMIALWVLISIGLEERTRTHQTYKNSICLYLALSMIISFAFISIKTGAPMWSIYGALAVSGRRVRAISAALPPVEGISARCRMRPSVSPGVR